MTTLPSKDRSVFVICGRDIAALTEMKKFLTALDLYTYEWCDVVDATDNSGPTNFEVVKKGLEIAGAIIVLLTPDEIAILRHQFVESGESNYIQYRPRPNVWLEFGMAYALDQERTIQVRLGRIEDISDIAGYNYIQLTNELQKRHDLAKRLESALRRSMGVQNGKFVNWTGPYWDRTVAGDFDAIENSDNTPESIPAELQILMDDDIFKSASDYLELGEHSEVLIYAPTGVWYPSKAKEKWFEDIAHALTTKGRKRRGKKLGNFIGVYGLPPLPSEPTDEDWHRIEGQLDDIKHLFSPFEGIDTAHLYYLDFDTENVPGTGTIIIDDTILALGWAIKGRYKVDYCITINEPRGVARQTAKWFNHHVMDMAKPNIIQEMRKGEKGNVLGLTMREGMDNVQKYMRKKYEKLTRQHIS